MEMPALRQHVWIVVTRSSESRFASRVEDIVGPMIHLALPDGDDAHTLLQPDAEAKIQFFDQDGHVVLDGTVVDRTGDGLLRFCPSENRGQRRQFLRWEADLPVQLRYHDEESWSRVRLVDIGDRKSVV